jgi:hypothetical protein
VVLVCLILSLFKKRVCYKFKDGDLQDKIWVQLLSFKRFLKLTFCFCSVFHCFFFYFSVILDTRKTRWRDCAECSCFCHSFYWKRCNQTIGFETELSESKIVTIIEESQRFYNNSIARYYWSQIGITERTAIQSTIQILE